MIHVQFGVLLNKLQLFLKNHTKLHQDETTKRYRDFKRLDTY